MIQTQVKSFTINVHSKAAELMESIVKNSPKAMSIKGENGWIIIYPFSLIENKIKHTSFTSENGGKLYLFKGEGIQTIHFNIDNKGLLHLW